MPESFSFGSWQSSCHFLSPSFLNLPKPKSQAFVEMLFSLPPLCALCHIICKKVAASFPALWTQEKERKRSY